MKLKTAALLLMIGAGTLFINICYYIYMLIKTDSTNFLSNKLIFTESLALVGIAGLIVLAFSMLKDRNPRLMKIGALIIVISSVAQILYFLWEKGNPMNIWGEDKWTFTIRLYLPLLANIVFGIAFFLQKFKMAAWGMAIGGAVKAILLLQLVLFLLATVFSDIDFPFEAYFYNLSAIVSSLIPIGLLMLADHFERETQASQEITVGEERFTAILNNDLLDDQVTKAHVNVQQAESAGHHNSVLWWMITFALASIPLAGLGFLMYFSTAKSQVKRGNWAVASMLVALLNTMLYIFLFSKEVSRDFTSKEFGIIIIVTLLILGTLAVISSTINKRNQDDITLDNHAYGPTVSGWLGYMVLMIVPIANIICLIVFAANDQEKYRQKWAQARLLWIPFSIINYLFYQEFIERLGNFL